MNTTSSSSEILPRVLIVKRPEAMAVFGDRFVASTKFEILKAFESHLPLPDHFLANQSHSVSAIIAPVSAPVTADLIRLLPDLRLVLTTSAGVDHVDLIECRRRGISVANAGSSFSEDYDSYEAPRLWLRYFIQGAKNNVPYNMTLEGLEEFGNVLVGNIHSLAFGSLIMFRFFFNV